ncbi:MAG TPA: hypothetical protein VHX60_16670 [Acidobacteriaceae bacterium]|nr:hypothetical protein [Acidobacteriaceae bacterium]
MELPTSRSFVPYLHATFRVERPVALDLELTDVRDLSNPQLEQFSLTFAGPLSPSLPQGTYSLQPPQREELSLFLVPLGPRGDAMIYEAVFTRFPAN